MSSQTKFKKDKEIIAEYEAQIKGEMRAGESCFPSPFLFLLLWLSFTPFPFCHHEMLFCINNLIVSRNSGRRTSPDWFQLQRAPALGVWIIEWAAITALQVCEEDPTPGLRSVVDTPSSWLWHVTLRPF